MLCKKYTPWVRLPGLQSSIQIKMWGSSHPGLPPKRVKRKFPVEQQSQGKTNKKLQKLKNPEEKQRKSRI